MKISSKDFLKVVSQMIREEVSSAVSLLSEGSGEQLILRLADEGKIKDIDGLRKWTYDKYFSEKNQGKRWYDPSVTPETVFDALVGPKSPISPRGLIHIWKNMPNFQKTFKQMTDKDIEAYAKHTGKTGDTYVTGDETLKNIAGQLGDVSKTMINKFHDSGAEKIKKLIGAGSMSDLEIGDFEELSNMIDQARLSTGKEFAEKLKTHHGDTKAFLNDLIKSGIITSNELGMITDVEVGGLTMLAGKPAEEIVTTLINDIEKDNNIFKTFQNAVSKRVFPGAQRGRPRKVVEPQQ